MCVWMSCNLMKVTLVSPQGPWWRARVPSRAYCGHDNATHKRPLPAAAVPVRVYENVIKIQNPPFRTRKGYTSSFVLKSYATHTYTLLLTSHRCAAADRAGRGGAAAAGIGSEMRPPADFRSSFRSAINTLNYTILIIAVLAQPVKVEKSNGWCVCVWGQIWLWWNRDAKDAAAYEWHKWRDCRCGMPASEITHSINY